MNLALRLTLTLLICPLISSGCSEKYLTLEWAKANRDRSMAVIREAEEHQKLSKQHYQQKEWQKSKEAGIEALRLRPNFNTYLHHAMVAIELKEYETAAKALQIAGEIGFNVSEETLFFQAILAGRKHDDAQFKSKAQALKDKHYSGTGSLYDYDMKVYFENEKNQAIEKAVLKIISTEGDRIFRSFIKARKSFMVAAGIGYEIFCTDGRLRFGNATPAGDMFGQWQLKGTVLVPQFKLEQCSYSFPCREPTVKCGNRTCQHLRRWYKEMPLKEFIVHLGYPSEPDERLKNDKDPCAFNASRM